MRVRFAIILLFLATCSTTTGNIDDTTEWETAAQQADRSVVFGRIRWIENGEEIKIGQGDFVKMSLRPDLVCMEDKQRIQGSVDAEGHFAWSLKPGRIGDCIRASFLAARWARHARAPSRGIDAR